MVELAIFGSFMLLVLVMVVRYGLSGYYAEAIAQDAFRMALRRAYETRAYGPPGSEVTIKPRPTCPMCLAAWDASYPVECKAVVRDDCPFSPDNQGQVILVRDKYVPDPSDLFDSGMHTQVVSNANVTWGTDRAEFDPNDIANSRDLPKSLYKINDFELETKSSRFNVIDLAYGPTIPQTLCGYFNVYGGFFVDFADSAGAPLEAAVSYNECATKGLASITFTNKAASPSTVTIEIADSCLGDIIDPNDCDTICTKLGLKGLPKPSYCSELPPLDTPQGLDLNNLVRAHTANNRHVHRESKAAIGSSTTIKESTTVERSINLNPIVWGNAYVDATTTVERKRQQDWNTNW